LVDGKLAAGHSTPEKLWNRLIVDSVTTKKLRRDGSEGSNSESAVEMEAAGQEIDEEKAKADGKSSKIYFPFFNH
jgi:hypothetical protein